MIKTGDAWGFTIFADDLREEVGGKFSVMGIYNSDYVVTAPELPIVVPKLVAMVNYTEVAGAISGDLKFRLTFPDNGPQTLPPIETVIQRSLFPPPAKLVDDEGNPTVNRLRIPFIISPFPIFVEGDIKVRCHFDDGEVLRLGRLKLVLKKASPDPSASGQPASQSPPAAPKS